MPWYDGAISVASSRWGPKALAVPSSVSVSTRGTKHSVRTQEKYGTTPVSRVRKQVISTSPRFSPAEQA